VAVFDPEILLFIFVFFIAAECYLKKSNPFPSPCWIKLAYCLGSGLTLVLRFYFEKTYIDNNVGRYTAVMAFTESLDLFVKHNDVENVVKGSNISSLPCALLASILYIYFYLSNGVRCR